MADTTNTGQTIGDDEQIQVTGKALRALGDGLVDAAAEKVTAKVTANITEPVAQRAAELVAEQIRAGNPPEALRGLLITDAPKVGEMLDPHRAYVPNGQSTDGVGFGMFARAYAASKRDLHATKQLIESWEKSHAETPAGQRILRAMNESNLDEGGSFVQQMYSTEYVPLLRNATLVRQAGARVMQMPAGNLSMGKITSGSNGYWRGEGDSATSSQLGTGSLNFRSRELVVQIPISKKLLRHASLAFDVVARDDAAQAGKLAEDSAFLRSAGSENRPKGLRHHAKTENIFAIAGTSAANVRADRRKAILKLTQSNIAMTRPVWFMSDRSKLWLGDLANANDIALFPEIQQGKWGDFPVFSGNQVPDNLGGGTESEIILADMFECFIGEDGVVTVEVLENVAYRDSSGTLVSSNDRGEIVIQLVGAVDFDVRYREAVSVMTGVTYGA